MPNNWTEQLERRRNGEEPGFIGSNESIEDFAAREAQHQADELAASVQPVVSDAAQGGAVAEAVAAAVAKRARKTPAKRARAKTTKR